MSSRSGQKSLLQIPATGYGPGTNPVTNALGAGPPSRVGGSCGSGLLTLTRRGETWGLCGLCGLCGLWGLWGYTPEPSEQVPWR